MKFKYRILLVALCTCFVTKIDAQHRRYKIQNGIGITGALTQYNLVTDNFNTKKGNGWLIGASATVDLPNKWYNMSYIIQLAENKLGIETGATGLATNDEFSEYKLFTAQIALLGHIKLLNTNLMIDAGPMLQYNSDLELKDDDQSNYIISGYNNLIASDIEDISNFNVNGVIGLSAGFDNFKIKAHYIYGFLNTLEKLNDQNLDTTGGNTTFKGNQSMIVIGAMFLF
ncbi:hypothetical protein RM697_05190 [Ichthyenterobacterium sp. W332]|uniref:Outer membrane protein beta-barrel domain-containing protein n=1 Tax=Microcosmobacter mediterraneus TaxID=3075607 RepID=A0ABU2YJ10_9FLAO|nr:hypothetical protein [Ichthyenterobacterium sp. W332]MDT0558027.1 hypothetical protein [Ichthyenterobacterium sp. W332]